MSSRRRPRANSTEQRMVRSLDALQAFDEFNEEVFGILRRAVKEAWSVEKIRAHPQIAALMEARKVSIALTDPDAAKALSAAKDVQDRSEGKAKERQEITHKMSKAPDEQLDARLSTLLAAASDESDKLPN